MVKDRLFLGDSKQMSDVSDESVHLVVTSPPYFNAIDYETHASFGREKNYRSRGEMDLEGYFDEMLAHSAEWLRVITPGGFACVVIGTLLEGTRHTPLPFDLACRMVGQGWEFHQDIIWSKVTGGVKRAGVIIQHPYPGYYYPNIMTEYIMVFRKSGSPIYSRHQEQQRSSSQVPIDDLFKKEIANNIWHIAPVPPNQLDHPCPFPEEIPRRLIQLYSYQGNTVLDPFNGIGTTTKVAHALGRHYLGYELIERYHTIAQERLNEPLVVRKQLYCRYVHAEDEITVTGRSSQRRRSLPVAV